MTRRQLVAIGAAAVLAATGLGLGLALGSGGSTTTATGSSSNPTPGGASYSYYQSMMGRFGGGSMMGGGGPGWMMGTSGYAWMMGEAGAPGWMRGGSLPASVMGANTDPGKVMGDLFADAPGPRVSPNDATKLGDQIPPGATLDTAAKRLTFGGQDVKFTVLASPSMPDENFRTAGMVNPTVVVPAGARVSIELINADPDMAHGLVVTSTGTASSWMPMMSAAPAFAGSALWFLGNPTSTGMHSGTIGFTASTPGTYQYLCPVPGHAQEGMVGSFTVKPT